jgi:hypothetical protein
MVAEHHERLLLQSFHDVFMLPPRKSVLILGAPYPFDLFLRIGDLRDVVDTMAGGNAVCATVIALS